MFVGVTGITLVDYFILRRERLDPAHLFALEGGKYAFWGGINWVAVAITGLATWGYLTLYDPVSLSTRPLFQYLGASLPTIVLSGLAYWVAVKCIVQPAGKGAYRSAAGAATRAVTGRDRADATSVSVGL
jgi:cytosine/uracil/thiamine/allantoin permease